ncbi:hypothetical protein [Kutzneria sp. 744]|uniref:hypothetical protein n=1 Tax=Kutzneria sp. (strain 744) TaxID=345341 RepID=UPI0004ADDE71|nr:hypothetical protein [Kutzneria sp. 744]
MGNQELPPAWRMIDGWLRDPRIRRDGLIALTLILAASVVAVSLLASAAAAVAVSGLALCSGVGATTAHIVNRKARRMGQPHQPHC